MVRPTHRTSKRLVNNSFLAVARRVLPPLRTRRPDALGCIPVDYAVAPTLKSIAVLAAVLVAAAVIAGAVAARKAGEPAYTASFVAAGIVWVAGVVALLLTGLPATGPGRVNGAMLSLLFRTGILLAALLTLSRWDHPLVEAGLVGLFLVHYFIGLAAETLLIVRLIRSTADDGLTPAKSSTA